VPAVETRFNSSEEAQQAFDDWLLRHLPSKVQVELDAFEAQHLDGFMDEYGRAVDQLHVPFDELVALVDQVNFVDKSAWPQHRAVQFILLAENLKTFHSAIDRLTKGSYQDAMTLTRTIYEAFLRIVHVSVYRDHPWGAVSNRSLVGEPKFNATGLVADVLRLDWRKYGLLSPFTHSNTFEVQLALRKIETREGEPERFGLAYEDNVALVEVVLPILQFLTYVYLRFVREVLIGSAQVRDTAQLVQVEEALGWARFVIAGLPKDYWRQVLDDTNYLFNVLETADAGGDGKRPASSALWSLPSRRRSSGSADGGAKSQEPAASASALQGVVAGYLERVGVEIHLGLGGAVELAVRPTDLHVPGNHDVGARVALRDQDTPVDRRLTARPRRHVESADHVAALEVPWRVDPVTQRGTVVACAEHEVRCRLHAQQPPVELAASRCAVESQAPTSRCLLRHRLDERGVVRRHRHDRRELECPPDQLTLLLTRRGWRDRRGETDAGQHGLPHGTKRVGGDELEPIGATDRAARCKVVVEQGNGTCVVQDA